MMFSLVVAAGLLGQVNFSDSGPGKLTAENFDAVKRHASASSADLAWQRIEWKNTVADGLNAGSREDKPVVMWMYFGDPRGHC